MELIHAPRIPLHVQEIFRGVTTFTKFKIPHNFGLQLPSLHDLRVGQEVDDAVEER
jgi:hypothetical protein